MWRAWGGTAVLAAALVVAPVTSAASASDEPSPRVTVQTERVATVGALRDRVFRLVNDRRRDNGCRALRQNAALNRAAQKHSRRMADANSVTHQVAGEAHWTVRIRREGYNFARAAENISGWPTPRRAVRAWMASEDHEANILTCSFRHTGVGLAYGAGGTPYWTQDFGHR